MLTNVSWTSEAWDHYYWAKQPLSSLHVTVQLTYVQLSPNFTNEGIQASFFNEAIQHTQNLGSGGKVYFYPAACTWSCAGSIRSWDCDQYKFNNHCVQCFTLTPKIQLFALLLILLPIELSHMSSLTWAPPSCMCTSTLFANISTTVSCDCCLVYSGQNCPRSLIVVESFIIVVSPALQCLSSAVTTVSRWSSIA